MIEQDILSMTNKDIFLYGALGAILGAFIVQLLPVGYALAKGEAELDFSFGRFIGMVIILVGLVAVGGLAALGLGSASDAAAPSEPVQAIAYGIGWQSTVGGLLNSRT